LPTGEGGVAWFVSQPKIPPNFSPTAWNGLSVAQQLQFWEGWIAALNFAMEHVSPDGISALSAEIAGAEEAVNALRPR
jgi:hypothetical protein